MIESKKIRNHQWTRQWKTRVSATENRIYQFYYFLRTTVLSHSFYFIRSRTSIERQWLSTWKFWFSKPYCMQLWSGRNDLILYEATDPEGEIKKCKRYFLSTRKELWWDFVQVVLNGQARWYAFSLSACCFPRTKFKSMIEKWEDPRRKQLMNENIKMNDHFSRQYKVLLSIVPNAALMNCKMIMKNKFTLNRRSDLLCHFLLQMKSEVHFQRRSNSTSKF